MQVLIVFDLNNEDSRSGPPGERVQRILEMITLVDQKKYISRDSKFSNINQLLL